MLTSTTRVILADDHALVRGTLAAWLNGLPDIQVVDEVGLADEAIEAALRLQPDVVVLDIDMPGATSFAAARVIRARLPQTRVLFLSAFTTDHYIEEALAAQAAGYISKGEPPKAVAHAIRELHAGRVYFSPDVQSRLVIEPGGVHLRGGAVTRTETLTKREREVLAYLARAMARKEIAQSMHISPHTVDRHTANVMHKLDIHDRAELCRFAIREGLATP